VLVLFGLSGVVGPEEKNENSHVCAWWSFTERVWPESAVPPPPGWLSSLAIITFTVIFLALPNGQKRGLPVAADLVHE